MTDRPKRQNAGNKMAVLLEKEDEDEFYKSAYGGFKDEDNDEEYESGMEDSTDLSDSDISNSENTHESDDDSDKIVDEEKQQSKIALVKAAIKKSINDIERPPKLQKTRMDIAEPITSSRCFRQSTQLRSEETKINIRKLNEDKMYRKGSRWKSVLKEKYSQEELLEEARKMESINLTSLESYKSKEAEIKRKAKSFKKKTKFDRFVRYLTTTRQQLEKAQNGYEISGPNIQIQNYLIFSDVDSYKSYFDKIPKTLDQDGRLKDRHERNICAITGLPAKYFDPLTKKAYYNVEAFQKLRETHKIVKNVIV